MIAFRPLRAPKQKFSVILSGRRCTFTVWYNQVSDRWSFDLALDGLPVLSGRRIVTGVDLLLPFNLGIGVLFAYSPLDREPNRENMMNGSVLLYHATREEVDAAVAA